jgi:phosphinothricin acetyltransferase
MVRDVITKDANEICKIYNHYIANTCVTFEEKLVSSSIINMRIDSVVEKYPWIVYEIDGKVVGYAYACEFRSRSAFRRSAEISIYVSPRHIKQGVGACLCKELLRRIRDLDIHCVVSLIALPNDASIKLHEKFGFEKTGSLNEIGFKFNKYITLEYWQLIL